MSRFQIVAPLALVLVFGATGGRVSVNKHAEGALNAGNSGPSDQIYWDEGDTFICTQKWEKKSAKFTGHFCLVNLEHIQKATESILAAQAKGKATPRFRAGDPSMCVSRSQPQRMKVCNLKGKEDMRVHYSARLAVPQSCFRVPTRGKMFQKVGEQTGVKGELPIFKAALDADLCNQEFNKPVADQGKLQKQAQVEQPAPENSKDDKATTAMEEVPLEEEEPEEATLVFNKPGLYEAAVAQAEPESSGDDEAEVETVEEPDLTFDQIQAMWAQRDNGAAVLPA